MYQLMSNSLLKNSSGAYWKNGAGQLLKGRPLNQTLLPQGLIGLFDADHVNNVGGYCQTMYDNTGLGNHFVQNNLSAQFSIVPNYINGCAALYATPAAGIYMQNVNISFSNPNITFFLVGKFSQNASSFGIGTAQSRMIGAIDGSYVYQYSYNATGGNAPAFIKNNKVIGAVTLPTSPIIIANKSNFASYTDKINLGDVSGANGYSGNTGSYIMAVAIYNRLLSLSEIAYNMAAYSLIYNIALEA